MRAYLSTTMRNDKSTLDKATISIYGQTEKESHIVQISHNTPICIRVLCAWIMRTHQLYNKRSYAYEIQSNACIYRVHTL